jgi:predicted SnoaL-like aldol condensation-catalyzing enzyme
LSTAISGGTRSLVLRAFDLLFNKRDYAAAEKYWSPHYIQHGEHIEPGREGRFCYSTRRVRGVGATVNWIAADILRIQDGILVEHWDVIQDEATEQESESKTPMW